MKEQILTLGSFLFFTGLVGFLTWRLTRGAGRSTSADYFLAGRALSFGFIAGSLLLTNLSTEQLVGLNGGAFKDGLAVMAWEVIAGLSLVVLALYFLPKYLKSGITTIPQFLEERFDAGTRTITTVILLIAYAGILLPIILYSGATGLNGMLDVKNITGSDNPTTNLWITVWVVGVIGSIYAIFGGLRTVAVSDTLNGFGLLVGGLLIAYLGLRAVNPDGVFPALQTLQDDHPEKFNSLGGPESSVPWPTLFTGVLLLNLFYWCTNQQIIQRTFGAKSLAEGQKGVLLAGGIKLLVPVFLVLPGIIAFHLSQTGAITATGDNAYGQLVRLVLPSWLTGFFAAAVVGAILSSFNSGLNSIATLFTVGVYSKITDADDKTQIRAGQIFGLVIALVSMSVAPLLADQESIFDYLQKMNAMYFIPIFPVVVIGLVTRRVPPIAAKAAMLIGLAVIAVGYFVPPFCTYENAAGETVAGWISDGPDGSLHTFHFLGVVFTGLVVMMLAIGRFFPNAQPWTQRDSGDVDLTPWRYAWPAGLGLAVAVVAIYAAFAG